jgi:hypothetical protein
LGGGGGGGDESGRHLLLLAVLCGGGGGCVEPAGVGEALELSLVQPQDEGPVHGGQLHRLLRERRVEVADI